MPRRVWCLGMSMNFFHTGYFTVHLISLQYSEPYSVSFLKLVKLSKAYHNHKQHLPSLVLHQYGTKDFNLVKVWSWINWEWNYHLHPLPKQNEGDQSILDLVPNSLGSSFLYRIVAGQHKMSVVYGYWFTVGCRWQNL